MVHPQRQSLRLLLAAAISVLATDSDTLAKPPNGWDPVALSLKLKDADAGVQKEALAKIQEWFSVDPVDGAKELRGIWGQALLATRHYTELASLTLQGILAVPGDTPVVEDLLQLRIKALWASGQSQQALQVAKSLFNVARPQKTSGSLLLLAQCLEKAHPEDANIYEEFQAQEVAGANPASQSLRCELLDAISVDVTPYATRISEYQKKELSDNRDIVALGNLQLMADETAKAENTFRLIDPSNVKLYAESLARSMKAVDGTIARANRYLLDQEDP